ncbi:RagB/SusD family nutrient uptake outer membrane protein [Nafulsella turpanensis]|uniref:RagB/SusD family nutrient uptake outer membrane protein n=1 Tax=Nafulsella turpanensis TaxID=1265690 RepID=UPI000344B124|nr:RagB/SusD family nutrient uptake outer membrane protein [Nafulsella turpanensis]
MIKNSLKAGALALMLTLGLGSCSDEFLEPEVTTEKDFASSVQTLQELTTVLNGAYDRMNSVFYYGRDLVIFGEVRSDNAFSNGASGRFIGPAQFFLTPNDAYVRDTWTQIYEVIANANIVINAELETDEEAAVNHVKGQAYAIRALATMDLLRLYGQQFAGGSLGIPVVTEFRGEDITPQRASVEETWAQVEADLAAAEANMLVELNSDVPYYITTWAVDALQSRYYLYVGQPQMAAENALEVIESGEFALSETWAREGVGSAGVIFALALSENDNLSSNSIQYIINATNYGDVEVLDDLYDAYEEDDIRQDWYTLYDKGVIRMTEKYAGAGDDIIIIRYAEVLLNYAEALVKIGTPDAEAQALEIINQIAELRGATPYEAASLDNVLEERRKELAFEGHRYFDLLRNGRAIPFVSEEQAFTEDIPFGSSSLAFPIPESEIDANPNIEQNADY